MQYDLKTVVSNMRPATSLLTVKPVHNDYTRDLKVVAVVNRRSLFRGNLWSKNSISDFKRVVVVDEWSILGSGC